MMNFRHIEYVCLIEQLFNQFSNLFQGNSYGPSLNRIDCIPMKVESNIEKIQVGHSQNGFESKPLNKN